MAQVQLVDYLIPLIFYVIIANPAVYKIVRGILGNWVANAEGLATFPGLVLHGLVYILIVGWIMTLTTAKRNA